MVIFFLQHKSEINVLILGHVKKKERKKERKKTRSWQESYGGPATNIFCPTFLLKITDFVTHYNDWKTCVM